MELNIQKLLEFGIVNEQSVKQKKEIDYKLDSLLKPYEGHVIFEVDLAKKEVKEAEMEVIDTVHFHHWKKQLKDLDVIKKDNCFYIHALNIANCKRKLLKISNNFKEFNYIGGEQVKQSLNKGRKVSIKKTDS